MKSDFTGSHIFNDGPDDVISVRYPVRIQVQRIENYTDGQLTGYYYRWMVFFRGQELFLDNYSTARTRVTAMRHAKQAAQEWARRHLTEALKGNGQS